MRGGPRKGFGGRQPGSGRKPDPVKTKLVGVKLTPAQHEELKRQGGSEWLKGAMNLFLAGRADAVALLFLSELVEKHGIDWLREWLDEKTKEGAKQCQQSTS